MSLGSFSKSRSFWELFKIDRQFLKRWSNGPMEFITNNYNKSFCENWAANSRKMALNRAKSSSHSKKCSVRHCPQKCWKNFLKPRLFAMLKITTSEKLYFERKLCWKLGEHYIKQSKILFKNKQKFQFAKDM